MDKAALLKMINELIPMFKKHEDNQPLIKKINDAIEELKKVDPKTKLPGILINKTIPAGAEPVKAAPAIAIKPSSEDAKSPAEYEKNKGQISQHGYKATRDLLERVRAKASEKGKIPQYNPEVNKTYSASEKTMEKGDVIDMKTRQKLSPDQIGQRAKADVVGLKLPKPAASAKPKVSNPSASAPKMAVAMKKPIPSGFGKKEEEPEDEDIFFHPHGQLGSKTTASAGGKHIGIFNSDEEAHKAAREWSKKNNWTPNAWQVSDHGNHHLIRDFHKEVKKSELNPLKKLEMTGLVKSLQKKIAEKKK